MYGVKERTLEFEESISKMHLQFDGYVYDPLSYALDSHLEYQEMAGEGHAPTMLMGMNPGPYGQECPSATFPPSGTFLKYGLSRAIPERNIRHGLFWAFPVSGLRSQVREYGAF